MSYKYLLDLYSVLDHRRERITREQGETSASPEQHSHLQGRIDCLAEFKSFLEENYHQKLPRRIQKMMADRS